MTKNIFFWNSYLFGAYEYLEEALKEKNNNEIETLLKEFLKLNQDTTYNFLHWKIHKYIQLERKDLINKSKSYKTFKNKTLSLLNSDNCPSEVYPAMYYMDAKEEGVLSRVKSNENIYRNFRNVDMLIDFVKINNLNDSIISDIFTSLYDFAETNKEYCFEKVPTALMNGKRRKSVLKIEKVYIRSIEKYLASTNVDELNKENYEQINNLTDFYLSLDKLNHYKGFKNENFKHKIERLNESLEKYFFDNNELTVLNLTLQKFSPFFLNHNIVQSLTFLSTNNYLNKNNNSIEIINTGLELTPTAFDLMDKNWKEFKVETRLKENNLLLFYIMNVQPGDFWKELEAYYFRTFDFINDERLLVELSQNYFGSIKREWEYDNDFACSNSLSVLLEKTMKYYYSYLNNDYYRVLEDNREATMGNMLNRFKFDDYMPGLERHLSYIFLNDIGARNKTSHGNSFNNVRKEDVLIGFIYFLNFCSFHALDIKVDRKLMKNLYQFNLVGVVDV